MLQSLMDLPGFGNISILELIVFAVLVVVGLIILVFILKLIFMFIPAAIIAFVVWFLTGSLYWAGIAFLVVAVLSIVRKF